MQQTSTATSGLIPSTPVAWPTSNLITVPTGRVVRTYSYSFRERSAVPCAVLHGHEATVSAVVSLPEMRLATGAADSTLRIWDVSTGHLLRTMDLANPIIDLVAVSSERVLALTEGALLMVMLKKEANSRRGSRIRTILKNILVNPSRVVAASDASLIAVADEKCVHLIHPDHLLTPTTLKFRQPVTAIEISNDAQKLAVALINGAIYIYSNPLDLISSKRSHLSFDALSPSKLHWHAFAVRALAFTHENTTLLSAGLEAALVSWKITPTSFGQRTILPRLGAPVIAISVSPNESTYALSHADNSVRLVDQSTAQLAATIRCIYVRHKDLANDGQRIVTRSQVKPGFCNTLFAVPDPTNTSAAWLGGTSGSVQSYDLIKGVHVDELSIIPRNFIVEDEKQKQKTKRPAPAYISMVAAHLSGTKFASIEHRPMHTDDCASYGTEQGVDVLKFWYRRRKEDDFKLEASVSRPHGPGASVTSVCFHPKLSILATTGSDGNLYLWRPTAYNNSKRVSWRNEVKADYKGLPCTSACFSDDGSLLGVSFRNVLTLWTLEDRSAAEPSEEESEERHLVSPTSPCTLDISLCQTLTHPPKTEEILSVSFVSDRVPVFIAATKLGIYVWDVVAQNVLWSIRTSNSPKCLIVDKTSGRFAVPVWTPCTTADMEDVSPVDADMKTDSADEGEDSSSEMDIDSGLDAAAKKARKFSTADRSSKLQSRVTPSSKTQKRRKQFVAVDSALTVFQASSPIPISVSRLSPGTSVAALAFVHNSERANDGSSSLVCIDSNMDVNTYSTTSEEEQSVAAHSEASTVLAMETEEAPEPRKLDNILGVNMYKMTKKGAKNEQTSLVENDVYIPSLIDRSLTQYSKGDIHAQAPIESTSFDAVLSLLNGMPPLGDKPKMNNVEENSDEPTKESSSNHQALFQNSIISEMESMRAFCSSLVKAEQPKKEKKKRKG